MIDDWEKGFSYAVLDRGFQYYVDGAISRMKPVAGGYEATVAGSEEYEVFASQDVERSTCTCPYFADRGLCKHIAAVFYEIEYLECRDEGAGQLRKPAIDLDELMDSVGLRECAAYLSKVLREDRKWRESFIRRYAGVEFLELEREFIDGVQSVISNNSHHGFVSHRNAYRCETEMSEYVCRFLDPLMERGLHGEAFRITTTFVGILPKFDIDESGGFSLGMAALCARYWRQLAEAGDEALRKAMLSWMLKYIEDDDEGEDCSESRWEVVDAVEKFIAEVFSQYDDTVAAVEQIADRKLENCPWLEEASGRYVLPSSVRWAQAKVRCMDVQGKPQEQIEEFVSSCPPSLTLLQPFVDSAKKSGDDAKAVALLERFMARTGDDSFSTDAAVQLLKLYKKTGDGHGMQEILLALVLRGRAQDDKQFRSWVRRLQACSAAEWPRYEAKLADELSSSAIRLRLFYAETERYDELLEALEGASRYELDRYWDDLATRRPDEYLEMYGRNIREALTGPALQRSAYREQVFALMRMQGIPGGQQAVADLVGELRERFPRRRALMEELNRLQ